MMDNALSSPELSARLRAGLACFRPREAAGMARHAPGLFSYCALARERLAALTLAQPVIGVVLSGAKEVWLGEETERLRAGALFVLPAGVGLDIVNEPDERTHLYQSLVLEIEPDEAPLPGFFPSSPAIPARFSVPLTPERVEAVLHAARAIEAGPAEAVIRRARLSELLALLHDAPSARPLFAMSVSQRVARLVRAGLDRDWKARDIARALAMSESTLRRRLAAEGCPLSALLRRERMETARRLMAEGAGSGAAALAVGYASRAHFARAFRAAFGVNPARA